MDRLCNGWPNVTIRSWHGTKHDVKMLAKHPRLNQKKKNCPYSLSILSKYGQFFWRFV